ncbi:MAG: hypothetical protein NXI16_13975 [Alphaproteobacteria bacterium]|nr:hypothetical protein [Alphaproteobacteria bacterium]
MRAVARAAEVSERAVRASLSGTAKPATNRRIEITLRHKGLIPEDRRSGVTEAYLDWPLPVAEALRESRLIRACWAEWRARNGLWPVDDDSWDVTWSAGLDHRGTVIAEGPDGFFLRHTGRALWRRADKTERLGRDNALLGASGLDRYRLCLETDCPVCVYAVFSMQDDFKPFRGPILNLPWRLPSGGRIVTAVSQRIAI